MRAMDWQPTPQEQAEISNRVALLQSALGLAEPSLSDLSFRSHREQRTVDLTLTIGKRNWAARFVHLGCRNNAVDRWELEYLVPQARNPDDVFTPVSDIVTRLDRSKMVLTSHDATHAQAAPGRIRNF